MEISNPINPSGKMDIPARDWPIASFPKSVYPIEVKRIIIIDRQWLY